MTMCDVSLSDDSMRKYRFHLAVGEL